MRIVFVLCFSFVEDVACADAESCLRACGSKVGCSNIAYPKLVLNILPKGEAQRQPSVHEDTWD